MHWAPLWSSNLQGPSPLSPAIATAGRTAWKLDDRGRLVMLCGLEAGRFKSGDRLAVRITSIDAEHRKVSVGLMP